MLLRMFLLFAAVSLVSGTGRPRCGHKGNCINTPDCCGASTRCYRKDSRYARCYGSCDKKGWDCTEVKKPTLCSNIADTATYTEKPTTEYMKGWSDCDDAVLKHIPGEWRAGKTCVGPVEVPKGTTYTLSCPADGPPCDWHVQHYHCPPCSGSHNGGLPGLLLTAGWESGSCGSFIANPFHHETVVFRRQVLPGETVTFGPTDRPTRYLTFHMVPGVHCESMSAAACDLTNCKVKDNACVSNWCPRRHIPRPDRPPCTNCLEKCS